MLGVGFGNFVPLLNRLGAAMPRLPPYVGVSEGVLQLHKGMLPTDILENDLRELTPLGMSLWVHLREALWLQRGVQHPRAHRWFSRRTAIPDYYVDSMLSTQLPKENLAVLRSRLYGAMCPEPPLPMSFDIVALFAEKQADLIMLYSMYSKQLSRPHRRQWQHISPSMIVFPKPEGLTVIHKKLTDIAKAKGLPGGRQSEAGSSDLR